MVLFLSLNTEKKRVALSCLFLLGILRCQQSVPCSPPGLMGRSTECAQSVSPPHHTGHTDTSHTWPQLWAAHNKKDTEVVGCIQRKEQIVRGLEHQSDEKHLKGAVCRGPTLGKGSSEGDVLTLYSSLAGRFS